MAQKKLNEDAIENLAIELLEEQGFIHLHGPDISPNGSTPLRKSFSDVVLTSILKDAIDRINPLVPASARQDALNQVLRISSVDLNSSNQLFHQMLTEGVSVLYQKDGAERGDLVWLVDFKKTSNNEFRAVNQLTISENNQTKRPDLILFVNGLPLIVFELKNAIDENATIESAYKQLETYKAVIPSLFVYNSILVISDGINAKAGSISSGKSRFMSWKMAEDKAKDIEIKTLIKGMLNKETLLDLIRHFIVFEKGSSIDPKTKIATVTVVKKIAAYHQYYAVNKAVASVKEASKENGNRKGGVVWHTQGSGKSLSMVFAVGKLVLSLDNPTVLVITDRNDLDDQLFSTFAEAKQLLRQTPVQASNRDELKKLLKVASGGVIFATIQKFHPEEGNIYQELSNRKNILVIADEAHRTQYGFQAKTIDDKDEQGNVIGKKIVYGFAKYMRDALPNATYLGFTGTPIEGTDINTPAVFGDYVDIYDINQAQEDGATVKIYYETRLAKVNLSDEGKELITAFDQKYNDESLIQTQKIKSKWTRLEAIIGSKDRIKRIAKDIVSHFENRQVASEGKGMIVSMSRRIAAALYKEIIALRPDWHSDDLKKGMIKVVMTSTSSDGPEMEKHHTTKEERRILADRMKNHGDELQLVIVRDMWLTGFDVPSMNTIYIDKPMKGHTLMQAIARVNRVYKDKQGGLVVDYLGIASDLSKALSFYAESGGKGDPAIAQEQAVAMMLEKIEIVSQMFHGFTYEDYFNANTSQKLSIILDAEDHILGLKDGEKRFIDEVSALSQVFAIAIPHEQAMDAKEKIAFFQAIKSRLCKFNSRHSNAMDEEAETAIKQIIDQALVSNKIINIFDAAGMKKPDISILSEEFLSEIKEMEQKNLALEVLKKLLNDEIRVRTKKNLVQSRTFAKMLESSIKKYYAKAITNVEVTEDLIQLAKEIKASDQNAKELRLSEYEYAFYTALAENDSAKDLMERGELPLKKLAITLAERIKKNASIDWAIKESAKAKLRTIVKKALREFGYPPDMEKLATEMILEQAELSTEEIVVLQEKEQMAAEVIN